MARASHPSIVIVGAGLAGLTAARELQQHDLRVRVFEPRDRVGGRVHTVRAPFHEGQYAEAGGELIEDEQEAVCELARALGLSLVRVLRRGFGAYLTNGSRGRARRFDAQSTLWTRLSEAFDGMRSIYQRAEHAFDSPIVRALGTRSVADHLDAVAQGSRHASLYAMATSLRGFYLADPEDLSSLMLLDQFESGDDPSRRETFRIAGGADRLATRLAQPLREAIALRHEVIAITQTTDGVHVAVRDAQGRLADASADYAIVTAPATAVRRIHFDPPLPDEQQHAIATLPYGRATKTLLQCARPFWRGTSRPRAYGTDTAVGALWDGSEEQDGRAAILVSLAGGAASAEARDLLTREGPEGFVHRLRWMRAKSGRTTSRRADAAPAVLACASITWEDDPWAGGGYAYFSPSFDPALKRWLSVPAGRVLFAGEHTSPDWQGYMNGAITSGRRAATEVLALAGRLDAA